MNTIGLILYAILCWHSQGDAFFSLSYLLLLLFIFYIDFNRIDIDTYMDVFMYHLNQFYRYQIFRFSTPLNTYQESNNIVMMYTRITCSINSKCDFCTLWKCYFSVWVCAHMFPIHFEQSSSIENHEYDL